ncbi:MAG TPA: TolC family protein [Tichowtungia sp.]|nr:TolC family protein [Tichowtungia sp.]
MIKKTVWTALLGLSLTAQALTLDEALANALEQSPELRAARAEAQAARTESAVASLWNNPELEVEAEGLGGDADGMNSAEYTAVISQEFPMFGKLRKRRAVADLAADAARMAALEVSRDFEALVRKAFAGLQAAEKIQQIRTEQVALAQDFLETAQTRYEAGAASEMDVLRARMELEETRGEELTAKKRMEASRKNLARLSGFPAIGKTDDAFFQTLEVSGLTTVSDSHPALRRFQTLEQQADAELAREKAAWLPDVTVSAGARYEEDGNVQTFLVGVGVPLPLFNRGRDASAAASFRAEAARAETASVRRRLEQALDTCLVEFETAMDEVRRVQDILLPQAERAEALCREGYASGRFGWMELLETRQMLEEVRLQQVAAQYAAWMAYIDLLKFKPGEGR